MAEDKYELTDWSKEPPPYEGCWEIKANNGMTYYAIYKDGVWDSGHSTAANAKAQKGHTAYHDNNIPDNPISWRGQIKVN